MKATVDQDLCIGCGYCENVCPSVFKLNFENKSEVIVEVIPVDDLVSAKDAETNCPVSAITIS
jgi:ferredoxin